MWRWPRARARRPGTTGWAGSPAAPRRATRYLDHHFLIVEAAAAGLGVALCPRILALDDLRSGRLAAPLGFTPDGSEYGLIEPKTVPPGAAPALTALKDWLTGAAREADA